MIPKIKVEKIDIELNIKLICRYVDPEFNKKNKTRPFAERTYLLYPELRGRVLEGMKEEEIYQVVKPCVERVFIEKETEIDSRIKELQVSFDNIGSQLMTNLIHLFEMDWPKDQETIVCYVGCISSFPRDVITKEFFISYEKEMDMLMMASIHEINHFVLFEKWKQMHGYDEEMEPMYPDTLWFLEEMAVDPTLNIESIQSVAPYPQKAYEQFYERRIGSISAEEHMIHMFHSRTSMEEFLDRAYEFIEEHKEVLI